MRQIALIVLVSWLELAVSSSSSAGEGVGLNRTAAQIKEGQLFAFLTIGDWGGANLSDFHTADEYSVSAGLGLTAAEYGAQFIVNVGDNHYYAGVSSTSDPAWKTNYEDVFTNPSLYVPWYSILGNHDYGMNPQAQVDYVSPTNDRWQMPARYYTRRIPIGTNSAGRAQYTTFIYLDTSPCIAKYRSDDPSGYTPPISKAPDFHANIMTQDCGAQYSWLKATLNEIDSYDWLIVVGHHPLEEVDVQDFLSLLQASNMRLYLTGHIHLMRVYTIGGNSKQQYIVSGAGCMVPVPVAEGEEGEEGKEVEQDEVLGTTTTVEFEQTVAGFSAHRFTDDFTTLYTEIYSYDGQVLYALASHWNT